MKKTIRKTRPTTKNKHYGRYHLNEYRSTTQHNSQYHLIKHWPRQQRYGEYFNDSMQAVRVEKWFAYLKRIRVLKKNLIALGAVPYKETQLIKTVNYFVKLINLVTNFFDTGLLNCAPIYKKEELFEFNFTIVALTAREYGYAQYHNKSEVGKNVTLSNLYLGMFDDISPEEITPNMKTTVINDEIKLVVVEMAPLSDWINNRVFAVNGCYSKIRQKDLAHVNRQIYKILLESINKILA